MQVENLAMDALYCCSRQAILFTLIYVSIEDSEKWAMTVTMQYILNLIGIANAYLYNSCRIETIILLRIHRMLGVENIQIDNIPFIEISLLYILFVLKLD